MAANLWVKRVNELEARMQAWEKRFDATVAALSTQIAHFRDEMRVELAAILEEMHEGDAETQRVLREEIRVVDAETRSVLRDEIRIGDEETRRLMRVLHEDVIDRLKRLDDGR